MKEYPSIETVYKRDKVTHKLDFDAIRLPEVSVVKDFTISEKIDGMNIRVVINLAGITVKGRTDAAQIKQDLVDYILSLFDHNKVVEYFTGYRGQQLHPDWSVTFYGEGYGAGIQKGAMYSPTKKFRCFDLMLGESWWLDDEEMRMVCRDLAIPTAPHLGFIDKLPANRAELAALLPFSLVAQAEAGHEVVGEGIVAKPRVVLKDRHNDRVVWKLTFREFAK